MPKPKFSDGERVLCFHGPLMYEAKTVKSEVKDKTVKYLIHYNGWNKSWDEWVLESRVLKYGEAALTKQKELKKAHEAKAKQQRAAKNKKDKEKAKEKEEAEAKKEKERASTPATDKRKGKASKDKGKDKDKEKEKEKDKDKDAKEEEKDWDKASEDGSTTSRKRRGRDKEKEKDTKDSDAKEKEKKDEKEKEKDDEPPRKRKIKGDVAVESLPQKKTEVQSKKEETYTTKIEVKVRFPDELKRWLIDDYDQINRQKQLVNVPCKVNVDQILDDFVKSKLSKPDNPQKDAVTEVSQGIRDYFNVMLGTQLLYKFERPQYAEGLANHPDKPMSEIYGATHLLRLFVRIGGMLAYTTLDEKTMQLLLAHLQDFLKYMCKNMSTYLQMSDYTLAPPEYHRKAL